MHAAFHDEYLAKLTSELQYVERRPQVITGVEVALREIAAMPDTTLGLVTGNYTRAVPLKLRAAGIDPTQFVLGAFGDDAPSWSDSRGCGRFERSRRRVTLAPPRGSASPQGATRMKPNRQRARTQSRMSRCLALLLLGLAVIGGWSPSAHALAELRAAQDQPSQLHARLGVDDHVGVIRSTVSRPLAPAHVRLPPHGGATRVSPCASSSYSALRRDKPAQAIARDRQPLPSAVVKRLRLPRRDNSDGPSA